MTRYKSPEETEMVCIFRGQLKKEIAFFCIRNYNFFLIGRKLIVSHYLIRAYFNRILLEPII
jgi:hypothetical protein